jgi:hypothetical protein
MENWPSKMLIQILYIYTSGKKNKKKNRFICVMY